MNKICQANLSDVPALKELYQNTVLTVNEKIILLRKWKK